MTISDSASGHDSSSANASPATAEPQTVNADPVTKPEATTYDFGGFDPPDFDSLSFYGWQWRKESTVDENFMDLAYLTARNSTAADGHMGCALVSGLFPEDGPTKDGEMRGKLEFRTINSGLFGTHRSDCHAEANAVSYCAKKGIAMEGWSVYVTRPPCQFCYKYLACAGVKRMVAPQPQDSPSCLESAKHLGIDTVVVRDTDERKAFRQELTDKNEDMDRINFLRTERKRLKKDKAFGKKVKAAKLE